MFRLSPRMVLLLPEAVADRMAQCTHALSRVGLSQPRSMHFIARSPNLITFVKLENRVEEYMEFLQGIGETSAAVPDASAVAPITQPQSGRRWVAGWSDPVIVAY